MNTIAALPDQSDYYSQAQFLNISINGRWLDELLDELYPGKYCKGLIPTLDFALSEAEQEVVWSRILPNEGETCVCPLLMCPDDLDFNCTLVVAEIQHVGKVVRWRRLGLDNSNIWGPHATNEVSGGWQPQAVGTTVDWFPNAPVLEFNRAAYCQLVEDFRHQFALDKAKWG